MSTISRWIKVLSHSIIFFKLQLIYKSDFIMELVEFNQKAMSSLHQIPISTLQKNEFIGFQIDSFINQSYDNISFHTSHNFSIICQRTLNIRQDTFILKYSFRQTQLKTPPKEQILLRLVSFLKPKSCTQIFVSKLNALTGELAIQFIIQTNYLKEFEADKISYIISNANDKVLSIIEQEPQKFLAYFNFNEISHIDNKNLIDLSRLKTQIRISPYYTWGTLDRTTFINKNLNAYQSTRKKFMELELMEKQTENSHILDSVSLKPKIKFPEIRRLQRSEDQQLFEKYLKEIIKIEKQQKQINEITVDQATFAQMINSTSFKITCPELQKQEQIAVKRFQKHQFTKYRYEKHILSRLHKNKGYFKGLPKYYFVKGKNKQTQLLCFTNMIQVKELMKYQQSNSNVLSLRTKFLIINQLSNALIYLRDSGIVFHNLIPKNIVVKRRLIINIFDFSNAYHAYQLPQNYKDYTVHYPYASKYPYVSNFQTRSASSIDQEKSDVYSLGVMAHLILYNRLPFGPKQYFWKFNQCCQAKLQNPTISIGKYRLYGTLITEILAFFIFMALNHELIKSPQNLQSPNVQPFIIKNRPYLDWIVIIFNHYAYLIEE